MAAFVFDRSKNELVIIPPNFGVELVAVCADVNKLFPTDFIGEIQRPLAVAVI
jgi:hypothetical protein